MKPDYPQVGDKVRIAEAVRGPRRLFAGKVGYVVRAYEPRLAYPYRVKVNGLGTEGFALSELTIVSQDSEVS